MHIAIGFINGPLQMIGTSL